MKHFLGICTKAIGSKGDRCYVDWYLYGTPKDIAKEYIKLVKSQPEDLDKDKLIGAVPSSYKNNYRLNTEFVKLNILQIDLDKNVSEDIPEKLKKSSYNCFWVESPSSRLPDKGFRLRIYVFLSNEVDNVEILRTEYLTNVNRFFNSCGIDNQELDQCAKRGTQFMYIPNKSKLKSFGFVMNKENFEFTYDYAKRACTEDNPFNYNTPSITLNEKQLEVLKNGWVKRLEKSTWRDGERHNKAYVVARDASSCQIDMNFALSHIIKKYLSSGKAGKDYESNLRRTVKDAYTKINNLSPQTLKFISKYETKPDYMRSIAEISISGINIVKG